jgi:acyl-CoA reductase-like NAD-dependent aldehyde dehydrogenase
VVIKPDGHTPYSALWALEVLEQAGVPCGLIQVVTGSGAKLVCHGFYGLPVAAQTPHSLLPWMNQP